MLRNGRGNPQIIVLVLITPLILQIFVLIIFFFKRSSHEIILFGEHLL